MELVTQAEFARRAGVSRQRVNALLKDGAFGKATRRVNGRTLIDFEPGLKALEGALDPAFISKIVSNAKRPPKPQIVLPQFPWPERVRLDGELSPRSTLIFGILIEKYNLPDLDPIKAIEILMDMAPARFLEAFPEGRFDEDGRALSLS